MPSCGCWAARRGHFLFESGHHGDLWLDLELLCLRPREVRALAVELADRLRQLEIDAVCCPLIEGAFVALMVAEELAVPFTYAESRTDPDARGLFPVRYVMPGALRPKLTGRRVAVINDVVNAGSAVRGTVAGVQACGVVDSANHADDHDSAINIAARRRRPSPVHTSTH